MFKVEKLIDHQHFIPEIAALKLEEYRRFVPDITLEDLVKGLEKNLSDFAFPIAYIVQENGRFVGAFSLRVCDLESHKHLTPWLGGLFVHPEQRKRGVGAFLISQAEVFAKERGFHILYLYTAEKALLYAKRGWTTIETAYFKHNPITIMEKRL